MAYDVVSLKRAGYHLPGFDDSKWAKRSPAKGLTKPGVGFFRTEFELHVPKGLEAPVRCVLSAACILSVDVDGIRLHHSFVYPNTTGNYRSQLYVNGFVKLFFVPL